MTTIPINAKHDDCRNLATIDVAKGYCHLNKSTVLIDTPVCPNFSALHKCATCKSFEKDAKESNIGVCAAEKHRPWTYPDLIAQSCELYQGG
jgi:hypothetical protein